MTVRFSFDAKFFDGDHEAQQEALTKLKNRAEAVASEPRSINRELNQFRNAVKKIYELIPISVFSGGRTVRDQWALLNDLDIRVDSYEDAAATLDPKTDAKRPLSGVEMPERSGAKKSDTLMEMTSKTIGIKRTASIVAVGPAFPLLRKRELPFMPARPRNVPGATENSMVKRSSEVSITRFRGRSEGITHIRSASAMMVSISRPSPKKPPENAIMKEAI